MQAHTHSGHIGEVVWPSRPLRTNHLRQLHDAYVGEYGILAWFAVNALGVKVKPRPLVRA
jgi:hypothetical protein